MSTLTEQDFYGGAIKGVIPQGWIDASNLREIPDHQELYLSPTTLSSLIIEVNARVPNDEVLSAPSSSSSTAIPAGSAPDQDQDQSTIDQAATLYHLHDIADSPSDSLEHNHGPAAVSLAHFPRTAAYRGVVTINNSSPSSGAAPAPATATATSVHYLLVRLEKQDTDVLVFVNVPRKEFEERRDGDGLRGEEELAGRVLEGMLGVLEVRDWGLFG